MYSSDVWYFKWSNLGWRTNQRLLSMLASQYEHDRKKSSCHRLYGLNRSFWGFFLNNPLIWRMLSQETKEMLEKLKIMVVLVLYQQQAGDNAGFVILKEKVISFNIILRRNFSFLGVPASRINLTWLCNILCAFWCIVSALILL